MPGGDGRGPGGRGPGTGWGMGPCGGRGFGGQVRGQVGGPQPMIPEEELKMLNNAKADIDVRLAEIEKELKKK